MRGRVMAIWTMMLSGLAAFGSLLVGGWPNTSPLAEPSPPERDA